MMDEVSSTQEVEEALLQIKRYLRLEEAAEFPEEIQLALTRSKARLDEVEVIFQGYITQDKLKITCPNCKHKFKI